MLTVIFKASKANVYTEVAKTTSYLGAKSGADESTYDRIFTTDEDRMMLERFWAETCNSLTALFKPYLVEVTSHPESHGVELNQNYSVTLNVPNSFDIKLKDSIESSMFSFFTNSIVAKWCLFTNRQDTADFDTIATSARDDIVNKLYHRKKPVRIPPSD